MSKTIKQSINCPQCSTTLVLVIREEDLGTNKSVTCPKCKKQIRVQIPKGLASKFESDPTCIGGVNNADIALVIETVPSNLTPYQSFELTSDYYTLGRRNSSGPEYRADMEVETADKKMSRKHAAIRKVGNIGFVLKDLGSKNGVTLNGRKLKPDEELYLKDDDDICIGETVFHVSITQQSSSNDDLTH